MSKQIEFKNGQIIDVITSMKEAVIYAIDNYIDNLENITDFQQLYILYKDGSECIVTWSGIEGKFKKNGIVSMIEENDQTYVVYGNYYIDWAYGTKDENDCFIVRIK